MINQDNFKTLLRYLDFAEKSDIFEKKFAQGGALLQVDFNKKEIIYPEGKDGLIVHNRVICNFSSAENAVVFECVHRLLKKGYHAKHLELEPKWKLGHGASGGRADILVRDKQNNPLLFIECKTAGEEFNKEKKKMETHGGQLFSYLQQEGDTKYLCLYESEFKDNCLGYKNAIVKIIDRQEDIDAFNDGNKSIKLYRTAQNKEKLFLVWKETFNRYFHYNGIFDDDVNAYNIELKPLKRKDLRPFSEAGGMFNTFMEILRHNNISDNANAFNRMLSLLLCKIVDEEKDDDAILDFQVKEDSDTPEQIQDRLQKLYSEGMKNYLSEDIVYFEDKIIKDIIKKYPRQTPLDKLQDIFMQIKYYTQNEFAIKEVHNKELFLENSRALNEIIKMLQNHQIRYSKKNQVLGDFFELLLSHGVKQSEGQFFTPIPIVRFMILSIGLEKIIEHKLTQEQINFLPKIMDFACGSGHFLTESIDELQKIIENQERIVNKNPKMTVKFNAKLKEYKSSADWAGDYIFGIEKDYRLARTSQIACFINGDGKANIIFGDGLENHDRLKLNQQKMDLILANPPYAVKAFKNYLALNNEDDFTLLNHIGENAKEIETLFVDRTAQALAIGGKAAIILPSSILNNNGTLHQATRKLLLEHFEIKAISEFGGKTFGATGTNTVVLFLQRRSNDFKIDRIYISEDLFRGVKRKRNMEHIDSRALLDNFIHYCGFASADYRDWLKDGKNTVIENSEQWQEYKEWFENLTEIKNLKNNKTFNAKNKQEQKLILQNMFYQKVLEIEEEKFYIFMLTLNKKHQPQQVIISTVSEKESLGYEFSARRGGEGIKINKDDNGNIQTVLYDEINYHNPQKINSYIYKNFYNEPIGMIDDKLAEYIKIADLTDMLSFDKTEVDKAISLSPRQLASMASKHPFIKLGDVINTQYGYTATATEEGDIRYLRITDITDEGKLKSEGKKYITPTPDIKNNYLLNENDLVVARSGSIGRMFLYKNVNEKLIFASYLIRLTVSERILPEFIFIYHETESYWGQVDVLKTTLTQPNLNAEKIKQIKIPLPPKNIQKQIVTECETIDKANQKAQVIINKAKAEIEKEIKTLCSNPKWDLVKLGDVVGHIESGKRPKGGVGSISSGALSIGGEHIHPNNGQINLTNPKYVPLKFYDDSQSGKLQENDILICKDGALTGKVALLKKELEHQPAMINEHVFILRCDSIITPKYTFYFLFSNEGQILLKQNITGSVQGGLNSTNLKNIKIPVPPLSEQKKIIAKVETLEQIITEAQTVINNTTEQKQAVMDKYLK